MNVGVNDQYADQVSVYEQFAKPMINDTFRGVNSALICSGPENSGKSYSLFGTDTDPGLFTLSINDLFNQIKKQ